DLAMALALEAVKVDDRQSQVVQALRDAAYSPGTRQLLADHTEFVWDVDFDSRGGMILSGSADDTACLWEARNGRKITCLGQDGANAHDSDVIAVEFFAGSPRALTADDTGIVKMWNTNLQGNEPGWEILRHTFDDPVKSFRLLPDDESVLVGTTTGLIHHWT